MCEYQLIHLNTPFIQFLSTKIGAFITDVLRNVGRDFRLLVSALATVARKSFNGKFTAEIDFPIGHFKLPLLMLVLEVLRGVEWVHGLFLFPLVLGKM